MCKNNNNIDGNINNIIDNNNINNNIDNIIIINNIVLFRKVCLTS